jgi:predicted molibdopterin-dependent oxidoreductase YjgC
VAIDTFLTTTAAQAHVVLPAAAYGEKSGTTTNLEGRISAVSQKITPRGTSRPDWMIAVELANLLGVDLGVHSLDDVHQMMVNDVAAFGPARDAASVAHDGVVMQHPHAVSLARVEFDTAERNAYNYRLLVHRKLYDRAVGTATSPSLAQLADQSAIVVHPLDLARVGAVEGDRVSVTSPHGAIVVPVATDENVSRGTALMAFNLAGADPRELMDIDADVTDVKIEKV